MRRSSPLFSPRLLGAAALVLAHVLPHDVRAAEPVTLDGELIDTWCYFSGVMGGPEATQGTAHHTCAIWCAAGGIPVGLLTDDGTVYIVLGFEGEDPLASDALLDVQSHRLTVAGTAYARDGLNYITIASVEADHGITNENHEDFGVVPGFAIPESAARPSE